MTRPESRCANIAAAPLAKCGLPFPWVASDATPTTIVYEWFYLELVEGSAHVVCIFSLRDPFILTTAGAASGGKSPGSHEIRESTEGEAPASAYVTWNDGGARVSYVYNAYEGEAGRTFRDAVTAWLTGETRDLELALVEHGHGHLLHVKLSLPDGVPHLPRARQGELDADAAFEGGRSHLWQLLAQDARAHATLTRVPCDVPALARARGGGSGIARAGLFFDVPLARALRSAPARTATLAHASCYFDHNAGREPLWALATPWSWWHACDRVRGTWQVGYHFPSVDVCYLADQDTGPTGVRTDSSGARAPSALDSVLSPFGRAHPRRIRCGKESYLFDTLIEAAPFYCRRSFSAENSFGTFETLDPRAIATPLCQAMMKARRTRVTISHGTVLARAHRTLFDTACRRLTEAHGKSFYLASHILPPDGRARAYFVYALCRIIDDATDLSEARPSAQASAPQGAVGSQRLIACLWTTETDGVPDDVVAFVERQLRVGLGEAPPLTGAAFVACARTVIGEMGLERMPFDELVAGQRMDEAFVAPADFAALYTYCFRVAGVVGLMMARVLGAARTPRALKAAEHLGIAMQITNILRDVREDAARGRCYLPADELARAGLTLSTLLGAPASGADGGPAEHSARASALMHTLGQSALIYYESALDGLGFIPTARGRLCVRLMTAIYGAILGDILAAPLRALRQRTVVPVPRRIGIFAQVVCRRHPLAAAGLARWSATSGARSDPSPALESDYSHTSRRSPP